MVTRFKVRELAIKFAPEDDPQCPHGSDQAPTECSGDSCKVKCHLGSSAMAPTQCNPPTCNQPPVRRDAGADGLEGSGLALLQQELRSAMSLER